MKPKILSGALTLVLLAGSFTSPVFADSVEDAIKYRQAVFTAFRWHFGAMGAMVRGKVDYDAQQFSHHANQLSALTRMPLEGFIDGSDMGDTAAKPELWENLDDINSRFTQLMADADNLAAAAGGSIDEVRPLFSAVAKNCKGCHDKYKED